MAKRTGVDALKLIGLLWRESPVKSRSGLTTQGLTSLAVEIADRDGIDALTIRALAAEAGVTAMALYPHIGGHSELIALMLDFVAGSTYDDGGSPDDADWRARVRLIAEANWEGCRRHPWITYVPRGRAVPGPGAAAKYEVELAALDGLGLTDIEMDQTLTALLSLVHGTARASLEVRRSRGIDEQDDARWWSSVEPALTIAMGDSTRFPTASRVARALGEATGSSDDPEGAYRRGLALLIDGLEHRHQPGTAS